MKKTILLSTAAILMSGLMSFDILYINGEPDFTGSPADGGLTCTTCHSDFAVNTGGGSVTIATLPVITAGYAPGSDYTITVTVTKTGQTAFGFGFEALNSNNTLAGTLTATNAFTQTMTGAGPVNMVHNGSGLGTDSYTFSFKWTAPAIGTGAVTFYASGNACNEDSGVSGDYVYTTSMALTEGTPNVGIAAINSNSIIAVYPNPAAHSLCINNTSGQSLNVIMYDLTGKMVFARDNISTQNDKISLLDIAHGTYIIKVYNKTQLLKSEKIVVMH